MLSYGTKLPWCFILLKIVNLYEKKQSDPFVLPHIFVLIIVVKRKNKISIKNEKWVKIIVAEVVVLICQTCFFILNLGPVRCLLCANP